MIRTIIIEDDPMVAQINCQYLQPLGDFQIDGIFNSGAAAQEYLKENEADPQEPGAAVQRDVPVSFDPHHRQYGYRSARELWLTMSDGPESTGHDPFREL